MKIIISPAKKMNVDNDFIVATSTPVKLENTKEILGVMRQMSYEQLQELWGCNDKLAQMNEKRIREMDLTRNLTPALISYEGLQYQHMGANVFTQPQWDYVNEHLRILSGFYGVLRPLDGIVPYRLEMQAKLSIDGHKDLYEYWGKSLYEQLVDEDRIIINLASQEYSLAVEPYLQPEDVWITCVFGEFVKGKMVQKGTMAKMARGEMVRYMATYDITKPEQLKNFDVMGYRYHDELSNDNTYVFIREKE